MILYNVNHLNFKMGNSNQLIGTQLKFIQNIQDPRFGEIDIYQNDEGRFLMKTVKTHIFGDRRHNQFKRILEWVQAQGCKLVVPIINRSEKHQKNICVQYEITTLYMEYFNYTLKDLIASKKDLEETQLWFVLVQMLNLVILLKKNKIGINLDVNNVFLTLKGHPTVYADHLLSFEDTICANQFGMGQLIARIMLQLFNLEFFVTQEEQAEKQMLGPLAKLCNKYKLMGRMVRQLLYRERPQTEILEQITCLLNENKIKKANEIKLIKFKYMIPQKKEETSNKHNEKEIVQHSIGTKNINKRKPSIQKVQLAPQTTGMSQKQQKDNKMESHLDKEALQKMLADITQKKRLNLEKMQKFQQKKDQMIQNSVRNQEMAQSAVRKRDGKENLALSKNNFRKSQKKVKPQKQRRITQGVGHYHIR